MNKLYKLLLALGVAATSLSSCSRSGYVSNTTTANHPTSEQIQAKAPAENGVATTAPPVISTEAAPLYEAATVVAPRSAPTPPVSTAKVVEEAAQPAVVTAPEVATANVAPRASAKPSLVQRLLLKSVVKKLNKIQQKQTTARNTQTNSLLRTAIYVGIAGLLAIIIGILIAGGSVSGGSGVGFTLGVVLAYLGYLALVIGVILLIVALIRGS